MVVPFMCDIITLYEEFNSMNNKRVPTPKACVVCEELFYGRSDAKTCSDKCRKKKNRKNEEVSYGV